MSPKINRRIEKEFPECFNKQYVPPEGAHEECITVYRACRSGKCDKESFLPTFQEEGYNENNIRDCVDPGQYSLSTYEKPKDIKRFASMNSDIGVPYRIARGVTRSEYGLVQRTRDRKKETKSSHVDWWLYKDATPHEVFEIILDFKQHLSDYKKGGSDSER